MGADHSPLVLHVVRTLDGGGMERTLVSLLREFRSPHLRHAVATLRSSGRLAARLPDDVACCAIGAVGRSRSAGLRLFRIARAWNVDVLHARGVGCWGDAILTRVLARCKRVVLGFHGLEASGTFGPRDRRCARMGLLAGVRFTSVFESGVRQLHGELGVPLDRIDLIPNGVHLGSFVRTNDVARQRVREGLQLAGGVFVVGIVGSLTPVKRHGVLIEAIARLVAGKVNVALLIVGDGSLRDSLEQRVRAAGIADRVCFTGWREDVPTLLACMDAYVCSSASEGMSNAVLEAMAAGLPVVATDVGDNGAILRDGIHGFIVKPESAEAIADALSILIHRSDLRERFSGAARARARRFDIGRVAERYEAYYRSLIAGLPGFSGLGGRFFRSTSPLAGAVRN